MEDNSDELSIKIAKKRAKIVRIKEDEEEDREGTECQKLGC